MASKESPNQEEQEQELDQRGEEDDDSNNINAIDNPDLRPYLSRSCRHTCCVRCVQAMWNTMEGYSGACPKCNAANSFPIQQQQQQQQQHDHDPDKNVSLFHPPTNDLTLELLRRHSYWKEVQQQKWQQDNFFGWVLITMTIFWSVMTFELVLWLEEKNNNNNNAAGALLARIFFNTTTTTTTTTNDDNSTSSISSNGGVKVGCFYALVILIHHIENKVLQEVETTAASTRNDGNDDDDDDDDEDHDPNVANNNNNVHHAVVDLKMSLQAILAGIMGALYIGATVSTNITANDATNNNDNKALLDNRRWSHFWFRSFVWVGLTHLVVSLAVFLLLPTLIKTKNNSEEEEAQSQLSASILLNPLELLMVDQKNDKKRSSKNKKKKKQSIGMTLLSLMVAFFTLIASSYYFFPAKALEQKLPPELIQEICTVLSRWCIRSWFLCALLRSTMFAKQQQQQLQLQSSLSSMPSMSSSLSSQSSSSYQLFGWYLNAWLSCSVLTVATVVIYMEFVH